MKKLLREYKIRRKPRKGRTKPIGILTIDNNWMSREKKEKLRKDFDKALQDCSNKPLMISNDMEIEWIKKPEPRFISNFKAVRKVEHLRDCRRIGRIKVSTTFLTDILVPNVMSLALPVINKIHNIYINANEPHLLIIVCSSSRFELSNDEAGTIPFYDFIFKKLESGNTILEDVKKIA